MKIKQIIAIIITLVLCITFGTALTAYTQPMDDVMLNLSLSPEGENPDPADFDDKGWTVYTQQGKKQLN